MKNFVNRGTKKKMSQRKYHLPIIGHFADRSIRFNSIIEAAEYTGLSYHLIFEAAIGKIKYVSRPGTMMVTYWEYENGVDWLRYKAYYIRHLQSYTRYVGFNG